MANFIVESRLYISKGQEQYLGNLFYAANKLYNNAVDYANSLLAEVKSDEAYLHYLDLYLKEKDEYIKKSYGQELNRIRKEHGLTEYALQAYLNVQRKSSLHGFVDANTAQKVATRLWRGVGSCLFGKGKKIHHKKIDELCSIEGKSNKSGIRLNKANNRLFIGKKFAARIKVRKNDYYKQEALQNEIAYCRIVRKAHKTGWRYYVQIVFKGIPPKKENLKVGEGRVFLDMGPSTTAVVSHNEVILETNAPKTLKNIDIQIVDIQRAMDRSKRMTNPQNYNKDGTVKSGAKRWNFSKNYTKLRWKLRNLRRLRKCYLTEYQNRLVKAILHNGNEVGTENIDFTSWTRRSKGNKEQKNKANNSLAKEQKEAPISEVRKSNKKKLKTIKLKNGKTKIIEVPKRKKRLGKSVGNNSPASIIRRIEQILSYESKEITYLSTQKTKLSQYNHVTNEYIKTSLSERNKVVGGHEVQRDCYSAFLGLNWLDEETIDRQRYIFQLAGDA